MMFLLRQRLTTHFFIGDELRSAVFCTGLCIASDTVSQDDFTGVHATSWGWNNFTFGAESRAPL